MIDYQAAGGSIDAIRRNGYGEGSRTETLYVTVDGEKQKENLHIEVGEMQYTEEEMQEIFHKSAKTLELEMLGQNSSLDHVEENLNLITKIPNQPILVEWEIDRYDLINIYGEIDQDAMSGEQEGVLVELKAFMRYDQDETKQALHVFHVQIFPKELTASEKLKAGLLALIEEKETETFTEEYVQLPNEWEGQQIEFRRKMDYRSFMFLGLGILVAFLLISSTARLICACCASAFPWFAPEPSPLTSLVFIAIVSFARLSDTCGASATSTLCAASALISGADVLA